ncbi:MAG: DUF177 domain-containing protein [Acidobacteriota bacterium]
MDVLFEWAEKEPYEIATEVEIDPAVLVEGGISFASPPRVDAVLARQRDHFAVDGRISATMWVPCSRCLENFLLDASKDVHLKLLPRPRFGRFVEIELTAEDMDTSFYAQEKLVLEDLITEQINLSLPMRPLCSPDCRGICPTCGVDRNRFACRCA